MTPPNSAPDERMESVTAADIVAWTAIAETMRDTPEVFSPYAASGCAKRYLEVVADLLAQLERLKTAAGPVAMVITSHRERWNALPAELCVGSDYLEALESALAQATTEKER